MAFFAPEVRRSARALRIVWVGVFISQVIAGFLLYRWRILSRFFALFGIPALIAIPIVFINARRGNVIETHEHKGKFKEW